MSSFPAAIKLKPGDVKEYARSDLPIYEKLISNQRDCLERRCLGLRARYISHSEAAASYTIGDLRYSNDY